ncbi:MAG: hypothetical protein PHU06_04825 [Gallionella sp.]|nr:hypothetical protein [Gallionella sp.]MDD4958869.1 hypothetical protein [Gallionella sp.]
MAAAQRQLRAAIRMYFAEEDEPAIHTVASAAYGLLKGLKTKDGRNEAADTHLTNYFYAARDLQRGKSLPNIFAQDQDYMRIVRKFANSGLIRPETQFDEVKAHISVDATKDFWNKRNRIANLLKHADRDASSHIPLDDVDNLLLIMQALGAHVDLMHENLEPEGEIMWLYWQVKNKAIEDLPKEYQKIGELIASAPEEKRHAFCAEIIKEFTSS